MGLRLFLLICQLNYEKVFGKREKNKTLNKSNLIKLALNDNKRKQLPQT